MGTDDDVKAFMILFKKMNERKIIDILDESNSYSNRGESKMLRKYLEVDLLIDVDEN
jgi:hypothetical protein